MADTSNHSISNHSIVSNRSIASTHPIALLTLCVLALGIPAGCAVGPNFKAAGAPANAGFTPAGSTPATGTASAPLPGGEAQRFVDGLDIPGQWWTLFRSPELNALIERALETEPDARVRAGGAARKPTRTWPPSAERCMPSLSGTYQAQRNRGHARRSSVCRGPAGTTTR